MPRPASATVPPRRAAVTSSQFALLLGLGLPLLFGIVLVADRKGAFRGDAFPTPLRRRAALILLFLVLVLTSLLPAVAGGRPVDISRLRFPEVFALQGFLAAFLLLWWWLSGCPSPARFLSFDRRTALRDAGLGVGLGLIGWFLTLALGLVVALVAASLGLSGPWTAPPLVTWIVALHPLKRLLIVACAMTLEEFQYRAFLQRRLGPMAASILFLLAHGGYGEPLFYAGLVAITAVLAVAFERTGSVVVPLFAHGTFDAIQLFVILPVALKLLQAS